MTQSGTAPQRVPVMRSITQTSLPSTAQGLALHAMSSLQPPPPLPPTPLPPPPAAAEPPQPSLQMQCQPGDDASLSAEMRSFAVIVCSACLYLEFPGCDVHGVLYTERTTALEDDALDSATTTASAATAGADGGAPSIVTTTSATSSVHAKCPQCSAATHNVRPFRDGCRRCKAPTTVRMWSSTRREIAQAYEAFPLHCEELAHTTLSCERCQSVIFPRARDALTKRTSEHAMTSTVNGKPLKVSNFQLSMPHVEGCLRKGMPLQALAVQLTKSELKFVFERIEQCPVTPRILGGPQYRRRQHDHITQQNHLHHIYLRLLGTVVTTVDATSPKAIEPLRQVLGLFNDMEPLALFHDWAPPRPLLSTQLTPCLVEASSMLNGEHGASNVLTDDEREDWRPKQRVNGSSSATNLEGEESITFHFKPTVCVGSIEIVWHPDFTPGQYVIGVSSKEDNTFETAAVVASGRPRQTISFRKRSDVSTVRLLISAHDSQGRCALRSVIFYEVGSLSLHTPADKLLQDLENWLLTSSLSTVQEVRDTALIALQRLALASGSLCGILQLATALLLNVPPPSSAIRPDQVRHSEARRVDGQDWNRLDRLSETAREHGRSFLECLGRKVLQFMVDHDCPYPGENSLLEKTALERVVSILTDDEQETSKYSSQACEKRKDKSPTPTTTESTSEQNANAGSSDEVHESTLYPWVTMAVLRPGFLGCVKRRSQLGMVLLRILSELSAWQMKRMQKAEEYASRHEETLMNLEEPYAIEVCPRFFNIANGLLRHVLSSWLPSSKAPSVIEQFLSGSDGEEMKSDSRRPDTSGHSMSFDLYNMLKLSFWELTTEVDGLRLSGTKDMALIPRFTPDDMCVGVLQVAMSNIRRFVLSRIDPIDVGIDPVVVTGADDLLAAPPALEPLVESLEQMASLAAKRSDLFFPVSLKAAAVIEVGMEAFYPAAHQRTKLLTSRMGKGATLEVHVRWPVQEREQEDPRYERLILMLQFECLRMGFMHAIRGRWQCFMHLVIQVPREEDTEQMLRRHVAPSIQQAGFSSWQVIAGVQEVSINLQRHLHWNRVEKMSQDSGSGWVRVYPREVAQYDDVVQDIDLFLADHDKRTAVKASRP